MGLKKSATTFTVYQLIDVGHELEDGGHRMNGHKLFSSRISDVLSVTR